MAQNTVDRARPEAAARLTYLGSHRAPGVLLCTLALTAACAPEHADTYQFSTPAGATINGLPLDATAVFKTDDDSLLITVANHQVNPKADDQVLVGITFPIEQETGLGNLSLLSETAQTVNIVGRKSASSVQGPMNMSWVFTSSGMDFGLCDNPGWANSPGVCSGNKGSG